jgi:hypothetical protein
METSRLLFTARGDCARARLDLSAVPSSYLFSWRYALRKYPGQITLLRLAFDVTGRCRSFGRASCALVTFTR